MRYTYILMLIFFFKINSSIIAQEELNKPILIPYRIGDHWGASDTSGNIVIKPNTFDKIFLEHRSLTNRDRPDFIRVEKNGKRGLIDSKGQTILPLLYDDVEVKNEIIVVSKNNQKAIFSHELSQLTPFCFKEIDVPSYRYFKSNLITVANQDYEKGLLRIKDDNILELVLDTIYSQLILDFNARGDTLALYLGLETRYYTFDYFLGLKEILRKAVDEDEEIPVFEDKTHIEVNLKTSLNSKSQRINYLKKIEVENGWRIVKVRNQKESSNKIVTDTLDAVFDSLWIGKASFHLSPKSTLLKTTEDNEITENWAIFTKNNKKGVINGLGETILEPLYDEIIPKIIRVFEFETVETYYFKCRVNSNWGIFNAANDGIIPPMYDDIYLPKYSIRISQPNYLGLKTKKDNKFGIISYFNDILVPFEMDNIVELDEVNKLGLKFFLLEKERKYGAYRDGQFFPPSFDIPMGGIHKINNIYPLLKFFKNRKLIGYGDRKGFYYFRNK